MLKVIIVVTLTLTYRRNEAAQYTWNSSEGLKGNIPLKKTSERETYNFEEILPLVS